MKSYKIKEQLLNHLRTERNLTLEENLLPIFDTYRYGQVIDPYKEILASSIGRNKMHIYDKDITLGSFVNMMYIDELISVKLVAYISHYEKILKKYICDKVCKSFVLKGDSNCCNYSFFEEMKNDCNESSLDCFLPLNKEFNKDGEEVLRNSNTFESRIRVIEKIIDFYLHDKTLNRIVNCNLLIVNC